MAKGIGGGNRTVGVQVALSARHEYNAVARDSPELREAAGGSAGIGATVARAAGANFALDQTSSCIQVKRLTTRSCMRQHGKIAHRRPCPTANQRGGGRWRNCQPQNYFKNMSHA
jgi:hypothetical protein